MTDTSNKKASKASDWWFVAIGFIFFMLGIIEANHYQDYGWINVAKQHTIPASGRIAELIIYLELVMGLLFFAFGFKRIFKSTFSGKT